MRDKVVFCRQGISSQKILVEENFYHKNSSQGWDTLIYLGYIDTPCLDYWSQQPCPSCGNWSKWQSKGRGKGISFQLERNTDWEHNKFSFILLFILILYLYYLYFCTLNVVLNLYLSRKGFCDHSFVSLQYFCLLFLRSLTHMLFTSFLFLLFCIHSSFHYLNSHSFSFKKNINKLSQHWLSRAAASESSHESQVCRCLLEHITRTPVNIMFACSFVCLHLWITIRSMRWNEDNSPIGPKSKQIKRTRKEDLKNWLDSLSQQMCKTQHTTKLWDINLLQHLDMLTTPKMPETKNNN